MKSWTNTFLGEPKPANIIFFDNGTAGVWDQYDEMMPQFACGDHTTTIRLLEQAGYDWHRLNPVGTPSPGRWAWALRREEEDPIGCGLRLTSPIIDPGPLHPAP